MSQGLNLKYRPSDLDEVIGQDHVVKSLKHLFSTKRLPHSFLFQGPSGTGKTTLARIVASELKCDTANIIEVDAGKYTGIDDMRELTTGLEYRAIGQNGIKFVIIDECHSLSTKAWNSLLKIVEEPPAHLYFAFCTTEPAKVIKTIQNRCHIYNLKEVDSEEIETLLDAVIELEELKVPEGTADFIARKCDGSPRNALVSLSKCLGCETLTDVAQVMEELLEDVDVIEIAKGLTWKKLSWAEMQALLNKIKETNPESIRIMICNYLKSAILREKDTNKVVRFFTILENFSKPYTQQTGFAELLLSIGSCFFTEE